MSMHVVWNGQEWIYEAPEVIQTVYDERSRIHDTINLNSMLWDMEALRVIDVEALMQGK